MFSTLLASGALLVSLCSAQSLLYSAAINSGETQGAITAFPTGNGTNVAILTNDTSKTLTGEFTNTFWTFDGLGSTYSLYMQPTASSMVFPGEHHHSVYSYSPLQESDSSDMGYGYVGINSGLNTPGFGDGDEDDLLVWNSTNQANGGSWYGVCPTRIPGYESAGIQYQAFWQSNAVADMDTMNCTTILFHF